MKNDPSVSCQHLLWHFRFFRFLFFFMNEIQSLKFIKCHTSPPLLLVYFTKHQTEATTNHRGLFTSPFPENFFHQEKKSVLLSLLPASLNHSTLIEKDFSCPCFLTPKYFPITVKYLIIKLHKNIKTNT